MSGAFGFSAVLIAIHWIPLVIAAWLWPIRRPRGLIGKILKVAGGVLVWPFVLFSLSIFTDAEERAATAGHAAGWYLIFSMLTFGVIPAIFIAVHVVAGRFAGLWIRARFARAG
ncbi:MAG: hypothetical protein AAGC56_05955 [Pseudomonadota bacterium]